MMSIRETCYNCKSKSNIFYYTENGFHLHQCKSCDLIFVINPPEEESILNAHQQGLHKGKDKDLVVSQVFQEGKARYLYSILNEMFKKNEINGKKWLDIGSGTGELLLALKQFTNNNIDLIGSEPNTLKRNIANAKNLKTSFIHINDCNLKFNFISILNVYSHLYEPVKFLKKLNNLLLPNGEIFIETSDTVKYLAKDHYKPFHLPDHLSFASEKIIKDIFLRNGYEFISIKKTPLVKGGLIKLIKETIKFIVPNYESQLIRFIKYRKTDIFLRFRKIK